MAERPPDSLLLEALGSFSELTVRIQGSCMEPVIPDGALVRLESRSLYLPGDIVAYRNGIDQLVCHRFLGYRPARNGFRAITRADNAGGADALQSTDRLLGKVVSVDGDRTAVPPRTRFRAVRHWIRAIRESARRRH